ncbi:MAG: DUF2314 domain-containing protein [Planctomycetes bacterium]|nr:DUF2314 domain-containing protein [Planctomycetota bacterium]
MRQHCILMAALILWGCSPSDGKVVTREGQPDVHRVPAADAEMNAAVEKARSSLPSFQAVLASPSADSSGFAVKVAFAYGNEGSHEHVWLTEAEFSGDRVSGLIDNEPVYATELKAGQRVTALIRDVSDWMYVERGILKGGYTVRVLLDRMSPAERSESLSGMGFRLE